MSLKKTIKPILALLLVLFCTGISFSQETEVTEQRKLPFKHQLGVNINNVLQVALGIRQDSATGSPYLATYRLARGNWGVRLALGGNLSHETDQEEGFADKIVTERAGIAARIGVERQKSIHPRWMVSFGLDAFGSSKVNSVLADSGFDEIETVNQSYELGVGPSVGVYFGITKNLFLFTEASIWAAYSVTDNARNFEISPNWMIACSP